MFYMFLGQLEQSQMPSQNKNICKINKPADLSSSGKNADFVLIFPPVKSSQSAARFIGAFSGWASLPDQRSQPASIYIRTHVR